MLCFSENRCVIDAVSVCYFDAESTSWHFRLFSSDSFTDIFRHFSVILLVDYFIVVEENGLKDSDICLDLTSSFLSWLLSKFPLRRLSFRFDVVTIHQNFVTSSKALKKVWVVRGVSKQLFSEGCEMLFLLTIYSKIVPCARL